MGCLGSWWVLIPWNTPAGRQLAPNTHQAAPVREEREAEVSRARRLPAREGTSPWRGPRVPTQEGVEDYGTELTIRTSSGFRLFYIDEDDGDPAQAPRPTMPRKGQRAAKRLRTRNVMAAWLVPSSWGAVAHVLAGVLLPGPRWDVRKLCAALSEETRRTCSGCCW